MSVFINSLASGTFYNYSDSKETVLNTLNDEIGAELRQSATSFDSLIKDTICAYFSYYAKNRENYMLTRSSRSIQKRRRNLRRGFS